MRLDDYSLGVQVATFSVRIESGILGQHRLHVKSLHNSKFRPPNL
jgi:hypothetical protein